jgi:hypothetical protein
VKDRLSALFLELKNASTFHRVAKMAKPESLIVLLDLLSPEFHPSSAFSIPQTIERRAARSLLSSAAAHCVLHRNQVRHDSVA